MVEAIRRRQQRFNGDERWREEKTLNREESENEMCFYKSARLIRKTFVSIDLTNLEVNFFKVG